MASLDKTKTEEKKDNYFNPYEEIPEFMRYSPGEKAAGLCKEYPFIPIGLAGALGILLYGVKKSRNRGPGRDVSQYLLHYRIYVQGFFVFTLASGTLVKALIGTYEKKQRGEIQNYTDVFKKKKRKSLQKPQEN